MGVRMRPRQLLATGGLVFLVLCALTLLKLSPSGTNLADFRNSRYGGSNFGSAAGSNSDTSNGNNNGGSSSSSSSSDGSNKAKDPPPPLEPFNPSPKPAPPGSHPIWHLITDAERELEAVKARQSRTLDEAVAEYRRRHDGLPPPPNFDKWYEFARAKGVQLIDEFDTVMESLMPFWGLEPATIRARAREALGFPDNALLGVQIRGGRITHLDGGGEWQQQATAGMMGKFLSWLPDMDLCFNLHDEPRVVVPHDDLSRLVRRAKEANMPAAARHAASPTNAFSRAADLNDGSRFDETKLTRFNVFAHQPTWTHSRLSCPPESPARALEESERRDDVAKYGLGELGFVYNVTALSDICNSPSLASTFGFFDRPNAYNLVLDLFPVFSQSKISSYADILYPSPWYWYEKVSYDEKKDRTWAQKEDSLYWRGSTTGGFSRNGGWRRQHRQRFVQKMNAVDNATILVNAGGGRGGAGGQGEERWEPRSVPRGDYRDLVDVYFSGVGQCDPGDCAAQSEFFEVKGHAEQQDAWQFKYLLDMDGNAFSGRFYAFLRSRSLVYKLAVFREWHREWLKPWAHYIPLSLQGDDWLEAVRFFDRERDLGRNEAERLANQQRDWAGKVLRHEDMEVWFFRLLLEYGRVIDDDRHLIGFAPGSSKKSEPAKAPVEEP